MHLEFALSWALLISLGMYGSAAAAHVPIQKELQKSIIPVKVEGQVAATQEAEKPTGSKGNSPDSEADLFSTGEDLGLYDGTGGALQHRPGKLIGKEIGKNVLQEDQNNRKNKEPELFSVKDDDKIGVFSEAVVDMPGGEAALCDGCEMDYEDSDTQGFEETMQKGSREESDEAMRKLKSQGTKVVIIAGVSIVGGLVGLTICIILAVVGITRFIRRRKKKKATDQQNPEEPPIQENVAPSG